MKRSHPKRTSASIPRVVTKNLRELVERQAEFHRRQGWASALVTRVTSLTGSLGFVIVHLTWFATWIILNRTHTTSFDPYPYSLLTLIVSLETIVLSALVLLGQYELQKDVDWRAELDLHINLLAEDEATTILKKLVRLENHLGIEVPESEKRHVADLLVTTKPSEIAKTIEDKQSK